MENVKIVFILNNINGCIELQVLANRAEHIDGWTIAYLNDFLVAAMKDEFIKGFYFCRAVEDNCFDCKYDTCTGCSHPYRENCKHSELWTPDWF